MQFTGEITFAAVPREVLSDMLLTIRQLVRRLDTYIGPKPKGAVDMCVIASANRIVIHGAAILRMADDVAMSIVDTEVQHDHRCGTLLRALIDAEDMGAINLGRFSNDVREASRDPVAVMQ